MSLLHSIAPQKSEALQRLEQQLERQRNEIRETERLIDQLKSPTELPAVAKSILAGTDYGFVSRSEGANFTELSQGSGGPPRNLWLLGSQQFMRNLNAMRGEYEDEGPTNLTPRQEQLQEALERLTLNSTEIWRRELEHGPIEAPYVIRIPYLALCYMLDVVFEGRYIPSRFFLLETVARMPYFSYITMLHLYETLGFWRRSADVKRLHFAEELNEYRHLLIMESLGGDQHWWVRFLAQHSAIAYYIGLCLLWAISPTLSYRFSELLETHAVNTYGTFLDENKDLLETLPPSIQAAEYYTLGASDPFYAEFQTSEVRRPRVTNLHDVFAAIQADEGDHVRAMQACLDPEASVRSISMERKFLLGVVLAAVASVALAAGDPMVDVGVDGTAVEALLAGAAGQLLQDGEEGAAVEVSSGAPLLVEGARRALTAALENLVKALAAFF